ncbi:phosphotransferase family protein [Streptomyces buecherae]|uniref:phosphotransferase family protein n=1 Tax=Streptomyces buecherae TaxID=2763006 RepID=UPI0036C6C870
MTALAPTHGGYEATELHEILHRACTAVGLSNANARLLRGHTNAVVALTEVPVVVKIARRGTPPSNVARTVQFVEWLIGRDFPTVPLHPVKQPVVIDGHAVTFWTYLPQPSHSVTAEQLAKPLRTLHNLPEPPVKLPAHDNIGAIHKSLSAITLLASEDRDFLSDRAKRLADELGKVDFPFPAAVIQGDPQHRNALHHPSGQPVLCDWDTAAHGQPEWDLVTVEVHCRRFGYGREHYEAFTGAYGFDVTSWPGYRVLRDIRELRMITTNARKVAHSPASLPELVRRIEGLRREDEFLQWNIL